VEPQHPASSLQERTLSLFASLRKIRQFERQHLPFVRSLIDLDIIIEVGYAQEQKRLLTPKTLFLLQLGSVTTVRRRLAKLTEEGVIRRRPDPADRRSDLLSLSSASIKLLGRYGNALSLFQL
jgi:DNA-binding MarR family transcriptional regulator